MFTLLVVHVTLELDLAIMIPFLRLIFLLLFYLCVDHSLSSLHNGSGRLVGLPRG